MRQSQCTRPTTLPRPTPKPQAKPVADYLLYSSSPKVAWLEHPQNPLSRPYTGDDTFLQIFPDQR